MKRRFGQYWRINRQMLDGRVITYGVHLDESRMRKLIRKALANKSLGSSSGPVTVDILHAIPVTPEAFERLAQGRLERGQ